MKIVCPHCGSLEIAGAPGCGACLKPIPSGPWFVIEAFLKRQKVWSLRTFGEGPRTEAIVKHIEKELAEIRQKPFDLTEWIDVLQLALDGYWRHGGEPDAIMDYLQAKQNVNCTRAWPAAIGGEPTEHDRTGESQQRVVYSITPFGITGVTQYCKRVPPIRDKDRAYSDITRLEPCECPQGNCMAFGVTAGGLGDAD